MKRPDSIPPTVALLLPNFTTGGAEHQALLLARGLAIHGWRPVILVVEKQGPLEEVATGLGLPIHDLKGELWHRKRSPVFWRHLAGCIRRISTACRRERACILQSFLFWQNQLAVPAGRMTPGIQAIITGRRNTGDYKDRRQHYQPIENMANLFTSAIVCNSATVKADVVRREKFARGKVHLIPNAVDIQRMDMAPRANLREMYPQLAGATAVIGTVGNMKRQKRHDRFLEALALARRENPGLYGVVVGRDLGEEQSTRDVARHLGVEDFVVYTGGLADSIPTMKGFDLFVLSSDHEGMPNVVLEAMAVGVPVITTAVGGVDELILNRNLGRIVDMNSAEIAREILLLADDRSARRLLASTARERVARDFSPEALALRHARLYEKLTGLRGGKPAN